MNKKNKIAFFFHIFLSLQIFVNDLIIFKFLIENNFQLVFIFMKGIIILIYEK
jgi:hypothetical protein